MRRALLVLATLPLLACTEADGSALPFEPTSGAGGSAGATGGGGAGSGGDLFGSGGGSTGSSSGSGGSSSCGGVLHATVRDFSEKHPDFEVYSGTEAYTGIVEETLGQDGTPVYAHEGPTDQTSGPDAFAEWYHDVSGVNQAFAVELALTDDGQSSVYDNDAFFPIDGQGFGNEGNDHNFHFTTEVHTTFHYEGGETFTFTGDDDLWLFINGKLAIDLGGLHPELSETIELDALADTLGIEIGQTYPMDIFHAERHTNESNFRIQTTIECFQPPPE